MKNHKLLYLTILAFLTSCSLWQIVNAPESNIPQLPHKKHITGEKQMECSDCHEHDASTDLYSMPTMETCFTCHDLDEEKEKNPPIYDMLVQLKSLNKEAPWELFRVKSDVIFSHKNHRDKKVDCKECHLGIEESIRIASDVIPAKEQCMNCHETRGGSLACKTCHKTMRPDVVPPTHQGDWTSLHGDEMFMASKNLQRRCTLCHGRDGCDKCHQAEKPRSHNAFWRRDGHGLAAAVDQDRCALCHKQDVCVRCHHETKPRSHKASWGQPQNQHCLDCHLPFSGSSCALCHKTLPAGHPQ